MVGALKTYEEQKYEIIDKRIMYKVADSYKDISYGYNTVYAYLKEHKNGKVSYENYKQHLVITLCVAEFSYAQLPQYYHNIAGVTGTLTCLPIYIKEHLSKKYKIDSTQMFPIPSVYESSS